jgi:hypothetical protein
MTKLISEKSVGESVVKPVLKKVNKLDQLDDSISEAERQAWADLKALLESQKGTL